MSTLANYPKHLARRMAIRQRLAAEEQISRLTELIAYYRGRGLHEREHTLTEMRAEILADIEAGKLWPSVKEIAA